VPITVAAGALKVGYPTFAASVAVSTAIWAGIVMAIGVNFGPRMEAFLNVHRVTYWVWAGVVLIMIGVIVYRIQQAGPAAERAA
jgi:membrane protein DedA with SNARE-associated domain